MKRKYISKRNWSASEISLLKSLYPTHENKELVQFLNKSDSAIRNAAKRYGVKKTEWRWAEAEKNFILKNWESLTAQKIADAIGRTKWAVINKYREIKKIKPYSFGRRYEPSELDIKNIDCSVEALIYGKNKGKQ